MKSVGEWAVRQLQMSQQPSKRQKLAAMAEQKAVHEVVPLH